MGFELTISFWLLK